MSENTPLVSIGFPVYNGGKYMKVAIDSLLCQSYKNFELIISDNASNDNTEEICREYEKKDNRVVYVRNEKNLGATNNFNNLVFLSKGKYFKWAQHDDKHDLSYIEKCVKVLESDETIILCHVLDKKIDSEGKITGEYVYDKIDFFSPVKRFKSIIGMKQETWLYIHGLLRTKDLKKTRLYGDFISADRVLLSELALQGRFYKIPEYLFYRRFHDESYTEGARVKTASNWWNPDKTKKIYFPYIRVFLEYCKGVNHIIKESGLRIKYYLIISSWFVTEGIILTLRAFGEVLFSGTYIGRILGSSVSKLFKALGYT